MFKQTNVTRSYAIRCFFGFNKIKFMQDISLPCRYRSLAHAPGEMLAFHAFIIATLCTKTHSPYHSISLRNLLENLWNDGWFMVGSWGFPMDQHAAQNTSTIRNPNHEATAVIHPFTVIPILYVMINSQHLHLVQSHENHERILWFLKLFIP